VGFGGGVESFWQDLSVGAWVCEVTVGGVRWDVRGFGRLGGRVGGMVCGAGEDSGVSAFVARWDDGLKQGTQGAVGYLFCLVRMLSCCPHGRIGLDGSISLPTYFPLSL